MEPFLIYDQEIRVWNVKKWSFFGHVANLPGRKEDISDFLHLAGQIILCVWKMESMSLQIKGLSESDIWVAGYIGRKSKYSDFQ